MTAKLNEINSVADFEAAVGKARAEVELVAEKAREKDPWYEYVIKANKVFEELPFKPALESGYRYEPETTLPKFVSNSPAAEKLTGLTATSIHVDEMSEVMKASGKGTDAFTESLSKLSERLTAGHSHKPPKPEFKWPASEAAARFVDEDMYKGMGFGPASSSEFDKILKGSFDALALKSDDPHAKAYKETYDYTTRSTHRNDSYDMWFNDQELKKPKKQIDKDKPTREAVEVW